MSTLTASQVREIARLYTQDVSLKEGYELWGTATGRTIPYHRKWWILKGDEVVSCLDQGCYDNAAAGAKQRQAWAFNLGILGVQYRRNKQTRQVETYDPYDIPFVPTAKAIS